MQLRNGEEAYIYVLFEHKSYPEPLIAFQLLRYLVRIWERDLRQPGLVQLTPISPLVVYHGRAAWAVSIAYLALSSSPRRPPVRCYSSPQAS